MSIDRSGWMMFLITATCITYRSWARRPIASTTIRSIHSVSDAYSATLKHLFTPTHAASRHLVGQMSTTEIFTQRKAFYQALYNQCSLENCKVIHIAGTKGKGSTVECISAGLLAAGKKVGVFTSPHLHTARERIKFNRDLITREEIIELGCQAIDKMQNVGWPPVFFDYFLTMALLYFGRRQPEYIVLECGLGGRYDSTNFCDHPLITVITSISLDHQAVLGNSIEEIAWQKAGIMKANVPIFTAETQAPSVLDVFRKEAKQCNAPFHVVSIDREGNQDWVPVGHHTLIENASLAKEVLNYLCIPSVGMKNFYWPCRMETFTVDGIPVILDGCHNHQSVHLFIKSLRSLYPNQEIILLFGAGAEKCVDDMVEEVTNSADGVIFTQSKHFKSVLESQLLEKVAAANRDKVLHLSSLKTAAGSSLDERLRGALDLAKEKKSDKKPVIAICGSLFVAADAREALFSLQPALFGANDWVRLADPNV